MLKKFYNQYVKLGDDINKLRGLRKTNEERLRSGLKNLGLPSIYKIIEQGSIAMGTAIKNDQNEYDIDLAVIFKDDVISQYPSTENIKNIVLKSLSNDKTSFVKDPEARTNAVTVWYESGYHVDFAIYKKSGNYFEHAGKEWTNRDPVAISTWFYKKKEKYNNLQTVIQLIKFLVSLNTKNNDLKIGGLMLTILVVEFFEKTVVPYIKLEDCLIEAIKYIDKRLSINSIILNPDNNINLNNSQKDVLKVSSFRKILNDIIFSIGSIQNKNILFNKIFETTFFDYSIVLDVDIIGTNGLKTVYLDKMVCAVKNKIYFTVKTNLYFDRIRWEVINTGYDATTAKCLTHYTEDLNENSQRNATRDAEYRGIHRMICHLYLENNVIETIEREIIIK